MLDKRNDKRIDACNLVIRFENSYVRKHHCLVVCTNTAKHSLLSWKCFCRLKNTWCRPFSIFFLAFPDVIFAQSMQVDDRYHTLQGGPFSYQNILQGTGILIDMINGVANKHSDWTQNMVLKGGICGYNSGVSNVETYENMDVGTTGNDYSNDVTARAQYYYRNGYS